MVRRNETRCAPEAPRISRPEYDQRRPCPTRGRDERVVGVMDDECRHADRGKQCPHVHVGHERNHESKGRRARRQAFMPCPGSPNLLVPRHVRIHDMRDLPRAPHGDHCSDDFLIAPIGAGVRGPRIPRVPPARSCGTDVLRRTAPLSANAPSIATRTASRLPRSSSTALMLSAHCSKVGSAPGVMGSDAPVPGWSKKISRPSDVIASTHP